MGDEGARNGYSINVRNPELSPSEIGEVVKNILAYFEGNELSVPEDIKPRVIDLKKLYDKENTNSKQELLTYMREFDPSPMHGGRVKRKSRKSKKSRKSRKSKKSKKL
jgi:hypothetical protein